MMGMLIMYTFSSDHPSHDRQTFWRLILNNVSQANGDSIRTHGYRYFPRCSRAAPEGWGLQHGKCSVWGMVCRVLLEIGTAATLIRKRPRRVGMTSPPSPASFAHMAAIFLPVGGRQWVAIGAITPSHLHVPGNCVLSVVVSLC